MENETPLFIFKVDGHPVVGDLGSYARVWEHNQYGGDLLLSNTVLTWEDRDPITHHVKIQKLGVTESDYMLYEFSVVGFPDKALISIDGRA